MSTNLRSSKCLGIDDGAVDVGEDLPFVGASQIVAKAAQAVTDDLLVLGSADQTVFKRIDHASRASSRMRQSGRMLIGGIVAGRRVGWVRVCSGYAVRVRVAVISDAHGNAFALDAVLNDLQAAAPDLDSEPGRSGGRRGDPARAARLSLEAQAGRGGSARQQRRESWPGGRRGCPEPRGYGVWLASQLSPAELARLAALPLTAAWTGCTGLSRHA